jgi:hypothetical protein
VDRGSVVSRAVIASMRFDSKEIGLISFAKADLIENKSLFSMRAGAPETSSCPFLTVQNAT